MITKIFKKAYESVVLSYRQLRRSDRNILIFIGYGLLYDLFINLYKPFSVKFLDRLGGDSFHISLLNSLPGILAVFALIPGSLIINRFNHKKGIISIFFLISRSFVLALAFVPFLPEAVRPVLFVILLSSMNFPDAISQSGLQGFLGDVFDGHARSQAITLRNKFGQIIAPVVTLVTGLIITLVPKNDAEAIVIYQVFFILAFVIGLCEVIVFRRFKERDSHPGNTPPHERTGLRDVAATLRDRKFVAYLIPTLFFYFTYQAGWPLFSILSVKDLGATELQLAFSAVVSGITGFFSAGFWSRRIAKKGNEQVTAFAVFSLAMTVFVTAVAPNMYFYIAAQAYGGFTGIGIVITLLNGLLAATPEKNRIIYIAVYNTFINISLGISPFFANALYNAMGTRAAMFVVGGCRALAGFILFIIWQKNKRAALQNNT